MNWEFETPEPGIGLEKVSLSKVSGVPGLHETDPEGGDFGHEYPPQYKNIAPGVSDVAQSFLYLEEAVRPWKKTWRPT